MIKNTLLKVNLFISCVAIAVLLSFVFFFIFPSFKRIIITQAEENAQVIAEHLSDLLNTDDRGLEIKVDNHIDEVIGSMLRRFPINRINIYTTGGTVVWSTRRDLIGSVHSGEEFRKIALKGGVYSRYKAEGEGSLEGETIKGSVVETYVPVVRDGGVKGVFEIYLDVTDRENQVKRILYAAGIIMSLLGVGLFGILLYSSRRSDYHLSLLHKARREIERQYERFYEILEHTPIGIYLLDEEGRIEYVNPAMTEISGATKEEFIGLRLLELPTYREIGLTESIGKAFLGEEFVLGPVEYTSYLGGKRTVRIFYGLPLDLHGRRKVLVFVKDVTDEKRHEEERERLIADLKKALSEVKTLSGLIPICASCKKIRDDSGYWKQVEEYLKEHSEMEFSHGICPDCAEKLYPEFYKKKK